MKRHLNIIITILCLISFLPSIAIAQKTDELQIIQVMDKYSTSDNATFAYLSGKQLKKYAATRCISLQLKDVSSKQIRTIEKAIRLDRSLADVVEEQMDGGQITRGYYEFTGNNTRPYRFLIFSSNSDESLVVIYIEGQEKARTLITRITNQK